MIGCGLAFLPAWWAIPTTLLSRSAAAALVGFINSVASIAVAVHESDASLRDFIERVTAK
jgi:hypothetical protein